MINLFFLFFVFFADKEKAIDLPFLMADKISSNSVLFHYNCAKSLIDHKKFIPVYCDNSYVGLGYCNYLDDKNWLYAKVYLTRDIDKSYYLRANYKVEKSEFNQDGCYWQINSAKITKFVFVKNGSRFSDEN